MSTPSAVWTVRYTTPEGLECTLTLSGDDVGAVLTTARQVLSYDLARLSKAGAVATHAAPATLDPEPTAHVAPATNGNGTTPSNGHANGTNANGAARLDWCPVHKCAMQRRASNGETWYSHRTADGGWCRGKAPKAATP